MTLSHEAQIFLTWAAPLLLFALVSVICYIGSQMVNKLDKIATSVHNMENDLKVLSNDHTNLKEDHRELKHRVKKLEEA